MSIEDIQAARLSAESQKLDLGLVSDAELSVMDLPEPNWIIPDYLAEGLALLGGKPKMGKSWLALNLGYAIATGGKALNAIDVEQGGVLYLALEDTRRRLQARMRAVRQDLPATQDLHFRTDWPRLNEGGLEMIRAWLESTPNARLVILDTFAKVKARSTGRGTQYEEDYESLSGLKSLADEFAIAALCVTHTRKADADDVFDTIMGWVGLPGASDTSWVLRRDRGEADGYLFVTGRDIEEQESALRFHTDTGHWSLMGDADEYRRSREQNEILNHIIDHGPVTPKQIAEALDKRDSTVRSLLSKMRDARLVDKKDDKYVAV